MPKILLSFFISCLLPPAIFAQALTISGRVTDRESDEGIAFATIFIKGADTTISTDPDGYYRLGLKVRTDHIGARCTSYKKNIQTIKRSVKELTVNFEMERMDTTVTQKAALMKSQAAALGIVRKVIMHRASHDKKLLDSYGYEVYNKIQVDLIDLTDRFKNRKLFKPFRFVFKDIDSTSDVKPFLPFFLTETVSDYYHRKDRFAGREIIKASKVSGLEDLSISQFLGLATLEAGIYSDYLVLLGRQFISPVSVLGLNSYIYYLEDSLVIDHYKCYKIRFRPRSQKLAQLEGEMWVADSYFAVKRIRLKLQNGARDPIRCISLYDEFVPVGASIWMLKKEVLGVNAIRINNTPELILRKTTVFSHFIINEKKHILDSIFRKTNPFIAVSDSANTKSEAYWQQIRRNAATGMHEEKTYKMIDTLAGMKVTKRYINILQTVLLGYVDAGAYSFLGHASIQGWMFKYGMRTNPGFSKHIRLGGYGAYDTHERKGRYGAEALWLIRKDPHISLSASYRFDLVAAGDYNTLYGSPDFLATNGLRRWQDGQFMPLTQMDDREFRLKFEQEFKCGYSYAIGVLHQRLQPVNFNFSYLTAADNSIPNTNITAGTITEFGITQRFTWQERFINSNFSHIRFGSKFPIVTFQMAVGIRGVLGSQFNYQRLSARVDDTRLLGILGKLHYNIEAGKIFGTLPFLFLQSPNASETYISVWPRFNTISQYQFAADRYLQIMADHHLEGLILDRIPGIRRLKLREVWGAHMWWGYMTAANQTANYADLSANPLNTGLVKVQVADKMPFIEMNAGVENIFSFFRLDAVWRATYLDPRGTRFSFRYGNCGVRLSFAFQF